MSGALEQSAQRARLAIAALVAGVLVGGGWLTYRQLVREQWAAPLRAQEARLAAAVDTFCAADAELAADPFFQPSPRARDASGFLHGLLGFDAAARDAGVPLPAGTLIISDEVRALLKGRDFMDAALPPDAVDTSALSRAHDFDHWDLTGEGSPWTASSRWTVADAPMPRVSTLLVAARAHLVLGARAGTLPQAARDVRQLARLCVSSESLVVAMAGLALADLEGRASAWATSHAVEVGDWRPVDSERLKRARAVLLLSSSFLGPSADEATLARALACAQVSRCVGLTETAAFTGGLVAQLPEPQATRLRVGLSAVGRPDARCSFAAARYFAARPLGYPAAPTWIPGDDIGGLMMLLASRELDPLPVLADAGVPVVPVTP